MTFLCDLEQIKYDLRNANGHRTHGRLDIDDLDRARDGRDDDEIIVVVGKPATADPKEKVTLVIILQARRYAVAHAEETTVSDAENVKSFTMNHIDYFFPELVSHLNEILHHMFRP